MATQQLVTTGAQGRRFACSVVAVQAIIVNEDERLPMLSSPTRNRPGEWQVVSGSLEAAETVLAHTFHFDVQVQYMIGIHNYAASWPCDGSPNFTRNLALV
jgi:hypothetical protein